MAKRKHNISLECGDFGFDYIIEHDNGKSVLIRSDWDYPSVARTFGWRGLTKKQIAKAKKEGVRLEIAEIGAAGEYLSDNCGGKTASDPGYFD